MTTETDKTSKITLNVSVTGQTGTTANRSFNYVNPSATNDKALYYANKLAGLTSDTLNYVQRTNTAKLVAE